MYTRLIPSEEVGAVSAWQFGIVGDPVLARAVEPEPEPGPPPEPDHLHLHDPEHAHPVHEVRDVPARAWGLR